MRSPPRGCNLRGCGPTDQESDRPDLTRTRGPLTIENIYQLGEEWDADTRRDDADRALSQLRASATSRHRDQRLLTTLLALLTIVLLVTSVTAVIL